MVPLNGRRRRAAVEAMVRRSRILWCAAVEGDGYETELETLNFREFIFQKLFDKSG
jgi:hypothetical protein